MGSEKFLFRVKRKSYSDTDAGAAGVAAGAAAASAAFPASFDHASIMYFCKGAKRSPIVT